MNNRGYTLIVFFALVIATGVTVTVAANQMLASSHRANARHLKAVAVELAHSGAETGGALVARDVDLSALSTTHRERYGAVSLTVRGDEDSVRSCAIASSRYPAVLHLDWEVCVDAEPTENGTAFRGESIRWIPESD